MDAAAVHRSVVDVLVATAAPRCATFGELLCCLPGVPPDEAASAVGRLSDAGLVDPASAARLAPAAQPPGVSDDGDGADRVLPPPHPLDYDWRFTLPTAERLRDCCVRLTEPGDTIALLGTPTVLRGTAQAPHGRRWVLLEASRASVDALSRVVPGAVLCCDLSRDELPCLSAQAVLADPPWYPEHARAFLWAASRLSQAGAAILLAQPPLGTRPGVLEERASLLAFARRTGLDPVAIRPGELTYLCPPFERNALRACGLGHAVPATWRRGDLIEFRRAATPAAPRPSPAVADTWNEVVLRGVRIRFRAGQEAAGPADPQLLRIVDRDVLPSVSRRDPARGLVAVWTCGNKVFGCRSPGLLAVIAAALAARQSVVRAAEEHLGRPATETELARIRLAAGQLSELARDDSASCGHQADGAGSIITRPGPPEVTTRSRPGTGRHRKAAASGSA
jgi:hypothetical protein